MRFIDVRGKQRNAPTIAFTKPLMVADGMPRSSAFLKGTRTVNPSPAFNAKLPDILDLDLT